MGRSNWTNESIEKNQTLERNWTDERALVACIETALDILPKEAWIDREGGRKASGSFSDLFIKVYQALPDGQRTEVNAVAERLGYAINSSSGCLHRTTPYKSNWRFSGY